MKYMIQKGGKRTFGDLSAPRPAPPPAKEPVQLPKETADLLDQLEKEEAEEEARAKAEEEAALAAAAAQLSLDESGKEKQQQTPTEPTPPPAPVPKQKAPSGFAAGFLNKKTKAKLAAVSAAQPTPSPTPAPDAPSQPKTIVAPTHTQEPSSPVLHEPLHHVLPAPTPIYKPTPPPSVPASRATSPKPERRVAFDSTADVEPKPAKPKRAAIILPPPPGMEGATEEEADEAPAEAAAPAKVVERPIREQVVEREMKAPQPPKPRANLTSGRATDKKSKILNTMGFAPRAPGAASRGQIIERPTAPPQSQPVASTSTAPPPAAGPIHTISLSSAAKAKPFSNQGTIAAEDISDEEESVDPSLTSDGDDDDDSDSSAFYGSEDDSDEEVDIDAALHAREIALEYHRQRMNVGAGAGTGPLGGHGDAQAYDAWNQPDVPLDATLQGRVPSHGGASRFRTGRLESTQMIIPSLLQQSVTTSLDNDDELDARDGLTQEERDNIKNALEALASHDGSGKVELLEETKRKAMEAAKLREEQRRAVPEVVAASSLGRAPPVVQPAAKAAATAIAVPSNAPSPSAAAVEEKFEVPEPVAPAPPAPAAGGKKMSRFKARQLGLDA